MKYLIAVVVIAAVLLFLYYTLSAVSHRLTDVESPGNPDDHIAALAAGKEGTARAPDFRRMRRVFLRSYRMISKKTEHFECERTFFDRYYDLMDACAVLKRDRFRFTRLPGGREAARASELALIVLRSADGYVSAENTTRAFRLFQSVKPLPYAELRFMKKVFDAALVEYAAAVMFEYGRIADEYEKGRADGEKDRFDLTRLASEAYLCGLKKTVKGESLRYMKNVCADNGIEPAEVERRFNRKLAKFGGRLANATDGLKRTAELFGDAFVLSVSPVAAIYRADGVGFDTAADGTKLLYLEETALKAKRKRSAETVEALQAAAESKRDGRDLSFYVLRPPRGKAAMRLYVTAVSAAALVLPIFLPFVFSYKGLFAYFLSLPISLALVLAMTADVARVAVRRRYLPLKSAEAVGRKKIKTLITVSRLIAGEQDVREAFEHIETLVYANPNSRYSYCMLLDLKPIKNGTPAEADRAVVALAEKLYGQCADRERICLLLRERTAAGGELRGWEKKRGALIELNRLALGKPAKSRFLLRLGELPHARYNVALDSDTLINCADALVAAMEHPYNASVNVLGIVMKPSVKSAAKTLFSRLYAGDGGTNGYNQYLCDVDYDLFGSGNFTGKGIYRIRAFDEATGEAFPENRILSHDFIEGAFAGCAVGGFYGTDVFPETYGSFLTRQLRWQRGDIQLLPYLFPRVKNAAGETVKNPISPIAKWHVFLGAFLPAIPIAKTALVALALFTSPYLLLVAFAGELYALVKTLRLLALGREPVNLAGIARLAADTAFLPTLAWHSLRTYAITAGRMIRKRNLLAWQVFAHARSNARLYPSLIFGGAVILLNLTLSGSLIFYAAGALFLTAVPLERLLRKERKPERYRDEGFDALLLEAAKRTMKYFEAQTELLPCDNYAENVGMWAYRTSPTDIGMTLVAYVSAVELSIVPYHTAEAAVEKLMRSIAAAPKWKGHLYNWMDVNLSALEPRYVSTVDSGNLLAALILVKQYFPGSADLAQRLIDDTDMAALLDKDKGVFYIGFNETADAFDPNHYGLLGSESAIAYIVSIGLGKLPPDAWYNLSRKKVRYAGRKLLFSWTGGMFEYLMSALFFGYPDGSLLKETVDGAIAAHIAYAKKRGFPWGVSECQYTPCDNKGNYAYRAFGVPNIAVSDPPQTDTAAPYAAVLAVDFRPREAFDSLRRSIGAGGYGNWGFYESIADGAPVKSYMTHHQGMIMAGIANRVADGAIRRIMASSPAVRAAELCFEERAAGRGRLKRRLPALNVSNDPPLPDGSWKYPTVALLEGGAYKTVLDANGCGYSVYAGRLVGKYADRDDGMVMRIEAGGKTFRLPGKAAFMSAHGCSFVCENKTIKAETEVFITVEGVEARIVRIRSKSASALPVGFSAYVVPTLIPRIDYLSHPVFNDMFVETIDCGSYAAAKRADGKSSAVAALSVVCPLETAYFGSRDQGIPSFGRTLSPALGVRAAGELPPHATVEIRILTTADVSVEAAGGKLARAAESVDSGKAEAGRSLAPSAAVCRAASGLLFGRSAKTMPGLDPRKPTLVCFYDPKTDAHSLCEQAAVLSSFSIPFNFAVLYTEAESYYKETADKIEEAAEEYRLRADPYCSFIRKNVSPAEAEEWREAAVPENEPLPALPPAGYRRLKKPAPLALNPKDRVFMGGFDGDDYLIELTDGDTPAPWCNVIADRTFGVLTSESGCMFSWHCNSREGKLTAFDNDPYDRSPSEYFVLSENNVLWSPTKRPITTDSPYYARHGLGFTEYVCGHNGLIATERHTIALGKNAQLVKLTLSNRLKTGRKLDIMYAARPCLGDFKFHAALSFGFKNNVIFAKNTNGMKLYMTSSQACKSYAFHREAFYRDGKIVRNANLIDCGSDPALACSVSVSLKPLQTVSIWFSLSAEPYEIGAASDDSEHAAAVLGGLSCLDITTGNRDLDALLKWLPYQTACSRFYGRCGFYQVSGGYGFRDQLQDCLAMLYVDPQAVRAHILLAAERQFEAGDVLHWWHPPAVGVRTHICDDRLFLPLVAAEYVETTGDFTVLAEKVRYLENVPLKPEADSAYVSAERSKKAGSVLEHCKRAIEASFDFGVHGLVKMRGGDWNDAMNKVGVRGEGESVWASMFLYYVVGRFANILNDTECKLRYAAVRKKLSDAIAGAFENDRFLRAYTDDGRPIGSEDGAECSIDLLTQAWAVLSGACDEQKAFTAMKTAFSLVDGKAGIIKLFDPPFLSEDVGYISAYPPGVRENGGQYTHAAVWYVMAMYALGENETAFRLLELMNPVRHARLDGENYRVEPYVLAADVYAGKMRGRGGWTWYTGGASWLYACIVQNTVGIKKRGRRLIFEPKPPASLPEIRVRYRFEGGTVEIVVDNTAEKGDWRVVADGIAYNTNELTLTKSLDGKTVRVKRVE